MSYLVLICTMVVHLPFVFLWKRATINGVQVSRLSYTEQALTLISVSSSFLVLYALAGVLRYFGW